MIMNTGYIKSSNQKGLIFKFNCAELVFGPVNNFNTLTIIPVQWNMVKQTYWFSSCSNLIYIRCNLRSFLELNIKKIDISPGFMYSNRKNKSIGLSVIITCLVIFTYNYDISKLAQG